MLVQSLTGPPNAIATPKLIPRRIVYHHVSTTTQVVSRSESSKRCIGLISPELTTMHPLQGSYKNRKADCLRCAQSAIQVGEDELPELLVIAFTSGIAKDEEVLCTEKTGSNQNR